MIGAGIFWSYQTLRHMFPQASGFSEQLRGFNNLKQHMRVSNETSIGHIMHYKGKT